MYVCMRGKHRFLFHLFTSRGFFVESNLKFIATSHGIKLTFFFRFELSFFSPQVARTGLSFGN